MKADILIKNGIVYDPYQNVKRVADVAIKSKKILEVAENLELECSTIIDAEGCIVTPGLIDFHMHMYHDGSEAGINPDVCLLSNGVTTCVDSGSCGFATYKALHKYGIVPSDLRVFSYVNMSPIGFATEKYPECVDPAYYDFDRIKDLFDTYPEIRGLKLRLSNGVIPANMTTEPLVEMLKYAEKLHCNVVVHTTEPAVSTEELASLLREGDIYCHVFHGKGDTIVDAKGKVKKGIWEARDRGVIFDSSNGRNNFGFNTAIPAMEDGFLPDIISTDMAKHTMFQHPVISLPFIMSKYLAMKMDIMEVFRATTQTPARLLCLEEQIGSLKEGTIADVSIFKLKEQKVRFYDVFKAYLDGDKVLVPQMTIKDGIIAYRQNDFVG